MPYVPQHTPTWKQGFARSAAESANPGLWKGLVGAWYPSLGPTGLTLRDISGWNNLGILRNTEWLTSREGYVLELDGSNDSVNCGQGVVHSLPLPVTVSSFFEYDNSHPDDAATIFASNAEVSDYHGFYLYISKSSGLLVSLIGDGDGGQSTDRRNKVGTTIISNGWHSASAVLRGGLDQLLYVDGKEDGGTYSGTGGDMAHGAFNARIGASRGLSEWEFKGLISNVIVHSRALSPNEIQQLYQDPHALVRQRAVWFPSAVVAPPTGNRRRRILFGV